MYRFVVACRGVAKQLADLRQARAVARQRTGAAVPEIVDANVGPADDRPDALPKRERRPRYGGGPSDSSASAMARASGCSGTMESASAWSACGA